MRHSFDTGTDAEYLHLLSAWACEEGISLAELKCENARLRKKLNYVTEQRDILKMCAAILGQ